MLSLNDLLRWAVQLWPHQFYDTGAADFTDQLTAIVTVDPPCLMLSFLPGLGSEFPLAVKQAKSPAFGITATFLGGDGVGSTGSR